MVIAVTYENGEVFQHFGHTEHFKLYNVQGNHIIETKVVDTNGSGHGALAGFLTTHNVTVLICGGIGGGAKTALSEAGINFFPGVSGQADRAVEDYLANRLNFDPNTTCNHHGHEHGEGHTCGNHDCK